MDFFKLDCSTSSYHNSTNTGLIDMFFTKKCNYFSRGRRWECLILSQIPLRGRYLTSKLKGEFWLPVLHQLKLGQKLGHFGSDPLPPDQNVLIFNQKIIRFDPLPPLKTMTLFMHFLNVWMASLLSLIYGKLYIQKISPDQF